MLFRSPEADEQIQRAVASAHALPESSSAAAGALPSAASHLHHFSREFTMLRDAAGGVLENLWPDTPLPKVLSELSSRLDGAPAGIDEQVEMAARGGSDMALALVKSWYLRPEIRMASERIAKAVDLTQLVHVEPSSAARPAEDAGAGDTATTTDDAAP